MECVSMKSVLCASGPSFPIRRRVSSTQTRRPPVVQTQIGYVRVNPYRISKTRIFSDSQSSPTTTKKRTTGPPMTPPKDPNEGGGGGGGWGGNMARNIALNIGFLGLFFILESTGGGGLFEGNGGGDNFGGNGGGGGGGGGGDGGNQNLPQEPEFRVKELGESDDESNDKTTKRPKKRTSKVYKQQKRKKLPAV